MKRFLITLCAVIGVHAVSVAEYKHNFKPHIKIDSAKISIEYVHKEIDPVLNAYEVSYETMMVGDSISLFSSSGDIELDYMVYKDPELREYPTFEDYQALCRRLEVKRNYLYIDHKNGELTYYTGFSFNRYMYTEPIPEFEWELQDGSDVIAGYECAKATTTWRGRDWTAWYCDVPVDTGPWKFHGLPGLILMVVDSTGEQCFEAIEISNEEIPIIESKRYHRNLTREKCMEMLEDYCANIGRIFVESGMVMPQSAEEEERLRARRKFFSPIEKE